MKKKADIHKSPEEKLASNTESVVSAVLESNHKLTEVNYSIKNLTQVVQDKSIEMTGFTGVISSLKHSQDKTLQKLEEVKSAGLASNITLKKIEKAVSREPQKFPEFPKPLPFPEIKPTDMSETNRLLKELLDKELPEFPSIPEQKDVDFTATNDLLKKLLDKEDKDLNISVSLKIV